MNLGPGHGCQRVNHYANERTKLSIFLTHSCIVSKLLNLPLKIFHHKTAV